MVRVRVRVRVGMRAGQGRAGQGRAGQGRAGQARTGQIKVWAGHLKLRCVCSRVGYGTLGCWVDRVG